MAEERKDKAKRRVGGVTAGLATIGGMPLGRRLSDSFHSRVQGYDFSEEGRATREKLRSHFGIPVRSGMMTPEDMALEASQEKTLESLSKVKNPKTIGRVGGALSLMRRASPYVAGAGLAAHFMHKDRESKSAKRTRNISLGLAALAPAIETGIDAAETLRANRMLKTVGESTKARRANLAKGFLGRSSASLAPLALAGGIYGLDSLIRRHKKKQEELRSDKK